MSMFFAAIFRAIICLSILVVSTMVFADEEAPDESVAVAEAEEGEAPVKYLSEPAPEVRGPKRLVAVGKFDAIGAFRLNYGDWDIGGGISAMLTSALVESERFIVMERANVDQVLSEQQMKGQGLVNEGSGPALGKIIGVNILLYGSVTEFGAADKGSGFSIGASGGGLGGLIGAALSRKTQSGKVAIDLRLVDTTTSQVIEVYRVSKKVESTSFDISLGYDGVNLGTDNFIKTPLGEATRQCIEELVYNIANKANEIPWTGRVVDVEGGEMYVNAGLKSGLKVNDTFAVERITKTLTDPETGEVLKVMKKALGIVTLTEVEEKISAGKFSAIGPDVPVRGDIISDTY